MTLGGESQHVFLPRREGSLNDQQREQLDQITHHASTLADWLHSAHSSSQDYYQDQDQDQDEPDQELVNDCTAERLGQAAIMLARINHQFARLMEELDTSRNSIPHHQPRRRNSMEISTKDQVTVNDIFMTALRAHCPAPVSFPKVEVPISYDQHELPYLRINARYLADDPELNPRLMATLHTHTDGPLADAGITGSTVVTYTPLREQDRENL